MAPKTNGFQKSALQITHKTLSPKISDKREKMGLGSEIAKNRVKAEAGHILC